jgi:hypothetical protein
MLLPNFFLKNPDFIASHFVKQNKLHANCTQLLNIKHKKSESESSKKEE